MTPQNTIAIVYDYDQTLSPSYMQEDVIFPAFGINGEGFWRRCSELVREQEYDNELAYMKVMLDTFGMDRPTNAELKILGAKLNFYKGLPEMFEEFRNNLLTEEQIAHAIRVEHYIISSGLKVVLDEADYSHMCAPFSDVNLPRIKKVGLHSPSASSATHRKRSSSFESTKAC